MFGLGKHGPDGKYAVVLDIGSASVGAAIVASDAVTDENPIIYTHRELAIIRDANTDKPTRAIEEALLQVFLDLSGPGIKALRAYDPNADIRYIQATIAAPWSHTVSQQAEYTDDEEFEITNSVLESLIESAKKSADKSFNKAAELKRNGLQIISDKTLHITANGYTVSDPRGLRTQKLYISHAIGLAPSNLLEAIEDLRNKIFPKATIDTHSFMLVYYTSVRDLYPNASETCLIDITGEATEVGIMRNYELTKISHTEFGSRTIIRQLNDKLKLPEGTGETILSNEPLNLTDKQVLVGETIFEEYVESLAALFKSMGTILTVPKPLFIHCKEGYEDFFTEHVKTAAERATGGTHVVVPVTRQLFKETNGHDTAIFLSSHFFHKLHLTNALTKAK